MQINVRAGQAHRLAWFLTRVLLAPKIDKLLGRMRREDAAVDYVLRNAPAGNPQAVLRAMDTFATQRRWMMNVGPQKGKVLADALLGARAQRVLEIGAYCGYSATLMGSQLSGAAASLVSIEKNPLYARIARRIVAHAGLAPRVEVLTGTLAQYLATFQEPFDVVFLDHWKEEYFADLKRLEEGSLLRPGTTVVADNVGLFNVPDYLDYVRTSPRYASTFHETGVEYQEQLHDGIEVSVFHG